MRLGDVCRAVRRAIGAGRTTQQSEPLLQAANFNAPHVVDLRRLRRPKRRAF